MRVSALAAFAVCIGLSAGVASAGPWSDPQGRVSFTTPSGWVTSPDTRTNGFTYVVTGNANNECHVMAYPSPGTANATPARVRAAGADPARFTTELWTHTLNENNRVFPNNSATIQSTSIDSSQFWPIQRAEATSPERPVHAAMELRPGLEIVAVCMTYGGADRTDLYDAFIRSIATPGDAAWQAAAEAAPATPAPAPAPAPAGRH